MMFGCFTAVVSGAYAVCWLVVAIVGFWCLTWAAII